MAYWKGGWSQASWNKWDDGDSQHDKNWNWSEEISTWGQRTDEYGEERHLSPYCEELLEATVGFKRPRGRLCGAE